MKKIFFFFGFIIAISICAQEKATDVFNAKIGLIGAWISYEKAVSPEFTINGEIGYEGGFFYSDWIDNDLNYVFTTTLSLEGRFYYNFKHRIEKEKNTKNNSANYLALEATYTPDWGTAENSKNINVLKTFSVIPKYGLRRNLSEKFNFEFAVGPGYQWTENGNDGAILGIDVKFGYNF
jgi:hypothetical protein